MNDPLDPKLLEVAVGELIAEARLTSAQHPSLAELFAYSNNELGSKETEEIREHLMACIPCGDRVLSFSEELAPPSPSPTEVPERHLVFGFPRRWVLPALAATMMIAVSAGWLLGRIWPSARISSPVVFELRPQGEATLRNLPTGISPDLPKFSATAPFVLLLGLDPPDSVASLELVLVEAGMEKSCRNLKVRSNSQGLVSLTIPASSLTAGTYRIELHHEGKASQIFGFQVVPLLEP